MPLPPGHYRILAYREFHDLPRLMWVADEASRQWVLECPFDDALDDHAAEYRVHTLGTNVERAVEPWEKHAKGLLRIVGTVPVAAPQFDATYRANFHLTWHPTLASSLLDCNGSASEGARPCRASLRGRYCRRPRTQPRCGA